MQLTIQDIIYATGGRCLNNEQIGNKLITSIITDTRQITDGSLFVPLKGERFDGHAFVGDAFAQGAIATLSEKNELAHPEMVTIWVADTRKALLDLAAFYRGKFDVPVVAVTGSVGKTTTKDLIAAVLSAKYNTLKTEGNFNNEIGLPLTLFRLEEAHQMAVVEMGMNHFNEIHRLSVTASPDLAVITNIGVSHIENLGSQEGILQAKLEILDGLKSGGPLVINGDDPLLGQVQESEEHPVISCGQAPHQMYRASEIIMKDTMTYACVQTPKDTYDITIPALGEHMVYNSLVAIAIAEYFELTKEQILEGLMAYIPSKMRMNIKTYPTGMTVIDDAYNASPDSMVAALKVLAHYKTSGKRIAILGDMFEMGDFAENLHKEVGRQIAQLDVDCLIAVGDLGRYIQAGLLEVSDGSETYHYATKEACIEALGEHIALQDTVLVKASRGMAFEEIVKALGKVNNHE
ncbi:MAG: UDP-N-acetylmuramoyl-tripeptide--D-alanyl-D-alanine ligase [Cellulosilyticaceae bacterium]